MTDAFDHARGEAMTPPTWWLRRTERRATVRMARRRPTRVERPLASGMTAPTFYDAKRRAWGVRPRWRLSLIERRLRSRQHQLDARGLTWWYATRQVLQARGVALPPVTRRLP